MGTNAPRTLDAGTVSPALPRLRIITDTVPAMMMCNVVPKSPWLKMISLLPHHRDVTTRQSHQTLTHSSQCHMNHTHRHTRHTTHTNYGPRHTHSSVTSYCSTWQMSRTVAMGKDRKKSKLQMSLAMASSCGAVRCLPRLTQVHKVHKAHTHKTHTCPQDTHMHT